LLNFNKYSFILFVLKDEPKVLRIEKIDSPPTQQRSRLDSSGATGNTQANQTTSQNVLWLCN
jgi:hypothetical protein